MQHPLILKDFPAGTKRIRLYVPDPVSIAADYKQDNKTAAAYYWAKVWPAAIGLCHFLQEEPAYIEHKKVLELAAGPGLPGIFAAAYASSACISDIVPEAVALAQQNVILHQLHHVECRVIDWNDLSGISIPDTVLLSDINYDPVQFEGLLKAIEFLKAKQCTIVLSTPQRLMAKEFIGQLLPFCKQQTTVDVEVDGQPAAISIFVL